MGKQKLVAEKFYSGFEYAHDTYNAISCGSDGNIYYILSSDLAEVGGKFFKFSPADGSVTLIGDLTELCGEKPNVAIPQGKSHVSFYEQGRKLYFSTHVGFYELIDGMDRLPRNPPLGLGLYPGGHILSYDLESGAVNHLAAIPHGEGVVSMEMDTAREQIYGLTWPTGRFFHYDAKNSQYREFGIVSGRGEDGTPGTDFRSLCRSLLVNPSNGQVYFTTSEGDIYQYTPSTEDLAILPDVDMRLDYFGSYDPTRPGSMGYNWRKVFWHPGEGVAYGIHGNSGYLFRFDPEQQRLELVERLTSEPSRKSGFYDQFSYGYLGLAYHEPTDRIYYLTGGPIYENGKRVKGQASIAKGAAKGLENLHLVTYDVGPGKYQDHGPIHYEDGSIPTYVNSIALGKDGYVYFLARFEYEGRVIEDLVRVRDPQK